MLAVGLRSLLVRPIKSVGLFRWASSSASSSPVAGASTDSGATLRGCAHTVPLSVVLPKLAAVSPSQNLNLSGEMHLYRLYTEETDGEQRSGARTSPRPMVLCVHGSMSDGRVFYSRKGKGLAPFLARSGYDVYVLDLLGRGASRPATASQPSLPVSQYTAIEHELPAVVEFLRQRRREQQRGQEERGEQGESAREPFLHVCAHSWGGVLWNSLLARQGDRFIANTCLSNVYFG
jgi:pimeloyl-ACP methyl ester carboxylesterase